MSFLSRGTSALIGAKDTVIDRANRPAWQGTSIKLWQAGVGAIVLGAIAWTIVKRASAPASPPWLLRRG